MQTYYDILGISESADNDQIKSAFRRLAKLYHPDKNPKGKEEFEKILIAYEALIDSARRSQYDLRLKYGAAMGYNEKKPGSKKQKEWGFSDEELKRRQYYKEHYKKEYERSSGGIKIPRKNYNEYKYILFAAPIAVGLLMFIINAYEQGKANELKKEIGIVTPNNIDELKMTDNPLTSYFENPIYDTAANRNLVINNLISNDAVVAIFDINNKFLRSGVIKQGFYIEVQQLPNTEMNLKFVIGKNWRNAKSHKGVELAGGFLDNETFYILNTKKTNGYTINLDEATLNLMDVISEKDFFKRN